MRECVCVGGESASGCERGCECVGERVRVCVRERVRVCRREWERESVCERGRVSV